MTETIRIKRFNARPVIASGIATSSARAER